MDPQTAKADSGIASIAKTKIELTYKIKINPNRIHKYSNSKIHKIRGDIHNNYY